MSQPAPRSLADLLDDRPRPYRPHPLLEGAMRAWKRPKPRIAKCRGGPSDDLWSCVSPNGPAGFGFTPSQAFNDWQRWQR